MERARCTCHLMVRKSASLFYQPASELICAACMERSVVTIRKHVTIREDTTEDLRSATVRLSYSDLFSGSAQTRHSRHLGVGSLTAAATSVLPATNFSCNLQSRRSPADGSLVTISCDQESETPAISPNTTMSSRDKAKGSAAASLFATVNCNQAMDSLAVITPATVSCNQVSSLKACSAVSMAQSPKTSKISAGDTGSTKSAASTASASSKGRWVSPCTITSSGLATEDARLRNNSEKSVPNVTKPMKVQAQLCGSSNYSDSRARSSSNRSGSSSSTIIISICSSPRGICKSRPKQQRQQQCIRRCQRLSVPSSSFARSRPRHRDFALQCRRRHRRRYGCRRRRRRRCETPASTCTTTSASATSPLSVATEEDGDSHLQFNVSAADSVTAVFTNTTLLAGGRHSISRPKLDQQQPLRLSSVSPADQQTTDFAAKFSWPPLLSDKLADWTRNHEKQDQPQHSMVEKAITDFFSTHKGDSAPRVVPVLSDKWPANGPFGAESQPGDHVVGSHLIKDSIVIGETCVFEKYESRRYLLPMFDRLMDAFFNNPCVLRASCHRSRCRIELSRRILNRRVLHGSWIKYLVITISGPTFQAIENCDRMLKKSIPEYRMRRQYEREPICCLYMREDTPDNANLCFSHQRTGVATTRCGSLKLQSPFLKFRRSWSSGLVKYGRATLNSKQSSNCVKFVYANALQGRSSNVPASCTGVTAIGVRQAMQDTADELGHAVIENRKKMLLTLNRV